MADQQGRIPPEKWLPHQVSDSADYLDGPGPVYVDDLTPEQRAEFEQAVKTPSKTKRRRRRAKRRKS